MLYVTDVDRCKWRVALRSASTAEEMVMVATKIWEDGYRTAEAEITYATVQEDCQ